MIDVLIGMAGSLIVGVGFAIGYGLGVWSTKKEQPKAFSESESEAEGNKIPVTKQFENLMTYSGRAE